MKQANFILIGIILLSYIGLMFYIDSDSHFHAVNEDTLHPSNSSRPSIISGLRFEENRGQTDSRAKFICRDNNFVLYLTSNGSVIQLPGEADKPECVPLYMTLAGANAKTICRGHDILESRSNYFKGNDPELWITNVPQYQRVKYDQIYEGIDLIYYLRNEHIEFDFILEPGSNPAEIRMDYSGAQNLKIGEDGNLTVFADGHELVYKNPEAWQESDESRREVDVRFALNEDHGVYFELGEYEKDETLVIDPELMYASYLGGSDTDEGFGIAVDDEGCAYITGSTLSLDFPVTQGAAQPEKAPGYTFLTDVFVTKFTPDGSTLIYSTYLGGYGGDRGNAIAIDNDGNAYITGMTYSHDDDDTPENESFPVMNEYQGDPGSLYEEDVFLTKLNGAGNGLLYSTYLAGDGEDEGMDIALDMYGNAYITGINFSFDYPIRNAVIPAKPSYYYDAFVTKVNPSLTGDASLIYSTYLGGESDDDYGYGIAVDLDGHAYITGVTESTDFPTKNAFQSAKNGTNDDAFVTKLSVDGSSYIWSTYLGGSGGETGKAIAADTSGNAFATGTTSSFTDFPVTPGVVIETLPYKGAYASGYVTKFNAEGTQLDYSTYAFGGDDIAIDDKGSAHVIGLTNNSAYPTENAIQDTVTGSWDIFIMKLDPAAQSIPFSSFLGGSEWDKAYSIALDSNNVFLTGTTASSDFPVTAGAYLMIPGSSRNAFVAKISMPRDEFVVEVLQDPLDHDPEPIAFTEMDIYYIDISKPNDPFEYIETQTTDKNGLLHLPISSYEPGWPFLVRTKVYSKSAIKQGHEEVDDKIYDLYVDNLHIDNTGKIQAAYLENNSEDTTHTFLEHSWVGFNLVVGIEWQASDNYVNSLKSAYLNASKYMYDVTNGQACLQKIAIYDNKSNWNNVDVFVRAKNTEWPRAHVAGGIVEGIVVEDINKHVYLPPIFYGSTAKDINNIFIDPLNPDIYDNYEAFIHELGHYLIGFFDEYKSKDGTRVYPNKEGTQPRINFGFMDSGRDQQDPMSSEMSAFESSEYKLTAQFQERGATCWEYFRSKYGNTEGMVRAEFHSPMLLGLNTNEIVEGPLANELGVGSELEIVDKTGPAGNARQEFIVKDQNGELKPGAFVRVSKPGNRFIWEGKTVLSGPNRGRIKSFTAQPGDQLYFSITERPSRYMFLETVAQSKGSGLSKSSDQGNANEVILKTVQGNFKLLSYVKFTESGALEYNTFSSSMFSNLPTLQIFQDESTGEVLSLASVTDGYSIALPDTAGRREAVCMFKAIDSEGTSFFVLQDLNVIELDTNSYHLVPSQNSLEMWLDSESQSLTGLAILGSNFPAPVTGLPDSVLRATTVFAINQQPITEELNASIRFLYDADTLFASNPDAVTIYHWNGGAWQAMPTSVNTELSYASTKIIEPGFYAAFLDLTQSFVLSNEDKEINGKGFTNGFKLYQNYPNPFNPVTTIPYSIPRNSLVQLKIYNLLGQEVATLVNEEKPTGNYQVEFDASNFPSGVYLYRLRAGDFVQTKKMIY